MEITREIFDDLDAYEMRLLTFYKLVAQDGQFTGSLKTIAAKTGLSDKKVAQARDSLRDKGYLASVNTQRATHVVLA